MMRQLELEAVKADLAAVDAMLQAISRADDPVGWYQFERRRQELENQIASLQSAASSTAEVALYFGGKPVVGSFGIDTDFAARALGEYQTLVAVTLASIAGPLGARGPVPLRDRGRLMVTDVARGSFGFVLKAPEDPQLFATPLSEAITRSVELIDRITSSNDEQFDELTDVIDARLFASAKQFLVMLEQGEASLRMNGGGRELTLSSATVVKAVARIEHTRWEDTVLHVKAELFMLPGSRRFEASNAEMGLVRGQIDDAFAENFGDGLNAFAADIAGRSKHVRLLERRIYRSNGVRVSHKLLDVSDDP